MQVVDIQRLKAAEKKAIETRDRALATERNFLRDELLECVYRLNVCDPAQLQSVVNRIGQAHRALAIHADDVAEHFGVGRGSRDD